MTVVNFLDLQSDEIQEGWEKIGGLSPEGEINHCFQFLMKSMMFPDGMRESLVFHRFAREIFRNRASNFG